MGDSDERDGLDRAAILARRQRFIALTLGGLAACGSEGTPQPCLDVAGETGTTTTTASGSGPTDGTSSVGDGSSSGMPMPCLDVDPSTTSAGPGTTGDTTAADASSSSSSSDDAGDSGSDSGTTSG
jgi:hypothetical protein